MFAWYTASSMFMSAVASKQKKNNTWSFFENQPKCDMVQSPSQTLFLTVIAVSPRWVLKTTTMAATTTTQKQTSYMWGHQGSKRPRGLNWDQFAHECQI